MQSLRGCHQTELAVDRFSFLNASQNSFDANYALSIFRKATRASFQIFNRSSIGNFGKGVNWSKLVGEVVI
jgi:hypothetical protein